MKRQSKSSLDKRISYYDFRETLANRAASALRRKGYETSNGGPVRTTYPDSDRIGILKERGEETYIRTKRDKNWVLKVYGEEHVPELIKLLKKFQNLIKPRFRLD
jgi:hypothetical protein